MDKLRFATPGIPIRTKGDTIQGIKDIGKMGLGAFELEFVRSINIKEDKAPEIKKVAKESNVVLTCHTPYFMNLNSVEPKTYHASIGYVVNSAKILSLCGGWSVCFHAGYYQKQDPKKVYEKIKIGIKEIVKKVKEFDDKIWIRPEISGRVAQFGEMDEVINLSKEIEQVAPCIDFSHLYARSIGKNNTYLEFKEILNKVEKNLGKKALSEMHMHATGMNYGDKGEKNHLTLKESEFNYKDLMKILKEFKVKGVLTVESPDGENDALYLQKVYEKI